MKAIIVVILLLIIAGCEKTQKFPQPDKPQRFPVRKALP